MQRTQREAHADLINTSDVQPALTATGLNKQLLPIRYRWLQAAWSTCLRKFRASTSLGSFETSVQRVIFRSDRESYSSGQDVIIRWISSHLFRVLTTCAS